jgi:hypothetical protein
MTATGTAAPIDRTRVTARGYPYAAGVGFNPYRKYRATVTDYVLIALVCAIAIGLLAWAFLG